MNYELIGDELSVSFLKDKTDQIRKDYIDFVSDIGRSHVGGCLSMAEVVVTILYKYVDYSKEFVDRDKFVLSKGHCSDLLYCIFADQGLVDKESIVEERTRIGGALSGHADKRFLPFLDVSTGSLGHGLPIACGMAESEMLNMNPKRVFCVLGDGELHEGTNWEAAMYASHNGLGNLIAVVDNNGYSSSEMVDNIVSLGEIDEKFRAFGWQVRSINGNDMGAVVEALDVFVSEKIDRPCAIISHTKKGYGYEKAMEEPWNWHHHAIEKEPKDVS